MSKEYYEKNAEEFYENTVNAKMNETYDIFEKYLPKKNIKILDLGCGSGRDSLYFLKKGYVVFPLDISENLGEKAEKLVGKKIIIKDMLEIDYINYFSGIWACASILHIERSKVLEVFKKCFIALEEDGIFYSSFKYKDEDYEKDGRRFTCFKEEGIKKLLKLTDFKVIKIWKTKDVRLEREKEFWLNILLKK